MAKQVINIGTTANDNTGDPLRSAFDKVNSNFTELYDDDAGDVGSIIATAPIEVDQATGDVTVSLADSGIGATQLDVTGNGTAGQVLGSDGDGTFSWQNPGGSINSVVAGDGLTGGGSDQSEVTLTLNVDGTTLETNADAVRIKDDAISYNKLGVEFTTSTALTSATAIAVNTALSDVFTFTAGHSATLNFTNVGIGDLKSFIITGGGGSYTLSFGTSNTASATYNKISGDFSDTSAAKNLIQIKFVAVNEAWYSISQIA